MATEAGAAGEYGPLFFTAVGLAPALVTRTCQHLWLGLLWRSDLDLAPALAAKIRGARGIVATIAGLVASASLQLAFAVELFESKVDGAMRYGRWLLATADGAEDAMESAFADWARALLGSPPWRSAAFAQGSSGGSVLASLGLS